MKKLDFRKLRAYLPLGLMVLALIGCCIPAIADVGNQNRYSGGDGGGDGDLGVLIGYLIGLFIDDPATGMVVLAIIILILIIRKRRAKKQQSDFEYINKQVYEQAQKEMTPDFTA